MKEKYSKYLIEDAMVTDSSKIIAALDDLKGSYAVEYVLEILLSKGNQHTLYSLRELIKDSRK